MRRVRGIVVFAIVVAAGTVLAGWCVVPLLAAVRVRARPRLRAPVLSSMAGALLGWVLLLGWAALHGATGAVARRMSGVFGLPPWGFVLLTLAAPVLLAGGAALAVRPAPPR